MSTALINTTQGPNNRVLMPAALMLTIAAGSAMASPPLVTEITVEAGLTATHATISAQSDIEFMGGGGAAGDFDNDGDQDLFVIGGSAGVDRLYINDGTGKFTENGAAAGIARTHQGTGAAVGDYNNDGWLDILVTSLGTPKERTPGGNVLYKNNGDGTFTDVTAIAGVSTTHAVLGDAFSGAFGDYDLDGDLDLAVAGWLGGNKLFENMGDGTFNDVTTTALDIDMTAVRGFAPRFVDMDGDRYPELLFVADFVTSKYFVNNGDGSFTDQTATAGTGLDSNGMGNTFGDYDNDGVFDWYVSSRIPPNGVPGPGGSGNMLYLSTDEDHVFVESSIPNGVNNGYWGWGTVSVDMNHDGYLDLFEVNGFDSVFANDPSLLYLNDGSGSFADIAASCGMTDAGQGRGLINADFDRDGDQDIIVINNRQPMVYYRNDISAVDANSITIELNTSAVDGLAPNGFGTLVLIDSDSHNQMRYLDGGSNYLSQSELSVHAGLGSDTSASITIMWANGDVDVYPNVAAGRYTINAMACEADLTLDGILDFFDVSEFLDLFGAQHPQADLTGDGIFDFFDVSDFLDAFGAGCP